MIFPQLEDINTIEHIRRKYDPIVDKVKPHITLVFPFESHISKEDLKVYLETLIKGKSCFNVTLEKPIMLDSVSGLYLCLSVGEGNEKIKELHHKMYQGLLKQYKPKWLNDEDYIPHMTIGKFTDREALNVAYEEVSQVEKNFKGIAEKIAVEIIEENGNGIIELEIDLNC